MAQNDFSLEVTCQDGTKDIANGAVAPCSGHGGVLVRAIPIGKDNRQPQGLSNTQKWGLLIGGTLVIWYLLYKNR
jgi:hypothetical protein